MSQVATMGVAVRGLAGGRREGPAAVAASAEDTLYRRFFAAGIVTAVTAGASWGVWILWQIASVGRFTGVSPFVVNAHGYAMVFGWVGLFVMGYAYQSLPRLWWTRLAWAGAERAVYAMSVAGLVVGTVGMAGAGTGRWALASAVVGGVLQVASAGLFVAQAAATYRRSLARLEPWAGFVFAAGFWFVAMSVMNVWHTYRTMTAGSLGELVLYVSTYQAPLRDMQVHGMALLMTLGMSMRLLPGFYGVRPVPTRRAWAALGVLTAAVAGEAAIFVTYRWTGSHVWAAMLMVPWGMLAAGVWMVAGGWRLWRRVDRPDRSAKFVRAAYGWLGVSLAMLLLLPAYQAVSRIPFSHAYYGAIRHAITVGFLSLMIMGMASRMVPGIAGAQPERLSKLWGPFLLVNAGCLLRVGLQVGTDWWPMAFRLVGASGVLELAGLAWWGAGLVRVMYGRRGE
jgi:hypothetical protein